jgi:transcriptional regulator with XRE-family HTH domain
VSNPAISFGRNLRQYREAAGLTGAQLARLASRTASWVSETENGHRRRLPPPHTITRLCEVLGCTRDDLLKENLPEFPEPDLPQWEKGPGGVSTAKNARTKNARTS